MDINTAKLSPVNGFQEALGDNEMLPELVAHSIQLTDHDAHARVLAEELALAMDKSLSKHVLRSAGVPVVAWTDVHASEWRARPDALVAEIARARGLPCFVKPARLGSTVGINTAKT